MGQSICAYGTPTRVVRHERRRTLATAGTGTRGYLLTRVEGTRAEVWRALVEFPEGGSAADHHARAGQRMRIRGCEVDEPNDDPASEYGLVLLFFRVDFDVGLG